MIKEALHDYSAAAAVPIVDKAIDIVTPPVQPAITNPQRVRSGDYKLNYDHTDDGDGLEWPGEPPKTEHDPSDTAKEFTRGVEQSLGGVALARLFIRRAGRLSTKLGDRQEVATQRGSSASFTGHRSRKAHNKREGSRRRVSKLTRKQETIERKKHAVINTSLAYKNKQSNHRKVGLKQINLAETEQKIGRLRRGVKLVPKDSNNPAKGTKEVPLEIHREGFNANTGKHEWASESHKPGDPALAAQIREKEADRDRLAEAVKSDFDTPGEAIDKINTHGYSPFVRANEARQLKRWLRLHRDSRRIEDKLQKMADGEDTAGRRYKRQARRRVNAASHVVGTHKKGAELGARAHERWVGADDSITDKKDRASLFVSGRIKAATDSARRRLRRRSDSLLFRDWPIPEFEPGEESKLSKHAIKAREKFARARQRAYQSGASRADRVSDNLHAKRREMKVDAYRHNRDSARHASAQKARRGKYKEEKRARVEDRKLRKDKFTEESLEHLLAQRQRFIKDRNFDERQTKKFNLLIQRRHAKLLEDFRQKHSREPYQHEDVDLLLHSLGDAFRSYHEWESRQKSTPPPPTPGIAPRGPGGRRIFYMGPATSEGSEAKTEPMLAHDIRLTKQVVDALKGAALLQTDAGDKYETKPVEIIGYGGSSNDQTNARYSFIDHHVMKYRDKEGNKGSAPLDHFGNWLDIRLTDERLEKLRKAGLDPKSLADLSNPIFEPPAKS